MIEYRPFSSLGSADHGWLNAHFHFSFADYHNIDRMGWGALRVWNDDIIQPMTGFPPHPHANMEIITFVKEGAISHQDNQGNIGKTEAGSVQVMSAGTGIAHAEYNRENIYTRLFQIWIYPDEDKKNQEPSWGNKLFNHTKGEWNVLASGFDQDKDALPIKTASRVLGVTLDQNQQVDYVFKGQDRLGYLVVAKGSLKINDHTLNEGDAVAIELETSLTLHGLFDNSQAILVDTLR